MQLTPNSKTSRVCPARVPALTHRLNQRMCTTQFRKPVSSCRAQGSSGHAAALVGVGVAAAFLTARPAEAGLLAAQPFGGPASDPPSRVLVLDRQRVELLLANEFKERLHALPNDQLVQMLDELLASQQTTAPELFADVLNRQQQQQLQAPVKSGAADQLAGGLRKGLSQIWGFSQSRWQQNPSLAQGPGSAAVVNGDADRKQEAAAVEREHSSSSNTDTQPAWRAPWAQQGSTSSPAADALKVDPADEPQEAAAAQPKSPRWQFGLLPNAPQPEGQQQDQQQSAAGPGVEAAPQAAGSKVVSSTSTAAYPDTGTTLDAASIRSSSAGISSRSSSSSEKQASSRLEAKQQQQQQEAGSNEDEGAIDDLGESDITGGLLFGRPGSGKELLEREEGTSTTADATAAASDTPAGPGLGAAAAAKLQGLFKWAPQLPFASPPPEQPTPAAADASAEGSSGLTGPAAAEVAAGAAAAAAGAGGVLGGVSAAVSAAGGGLKGLLELPGEVADNVGGALEDWRYEAADAVSAVLQEQGPTALTVLGLTAAAGGGVLLVSSLLQPFLNGELPSSSKLSALLQASDTAAGDTAAAAAADTAGSSDKDVASGAAAAAADGEGASPDPSGESTAAGQAVAGTDDSRSGSRADRKGLFDNVTSTPDFDVGIPAAAAAPAAAVAWAQQGSDPAARPDDAMLAGASLGFSASASIAEGREGSLSISAAGGPNILWQRDEQPLPSAAAPAAVGSSSTLANGYNPADVTAAGSSGSILWQREEVTRAAGPAALGVAAAAGEAAASILWQRDEPAVPALQQSTVASAQPPAVQMDSAAVSSSSSSGFVQWQAQEATPLQHQVDEMVGSSHRTDSSSSSSSSRRRKQRLLSQLLSNAEDVVDDVQQQQQQWWPWQRQQQEAVPPPPPMPQQQWGASIGGPFPRQEWAPAAGDATSNTGPGSSSSSGGGGGGVTGSRPAAAAAAAAAARYNPKSLWPLILGTSSTAFSYASLASVDLSEGDVSLVLPNELPADPWGTTPAGLVPSEQELAGLGVLQAELQGLAAAAAACKDAALSESPWCKHTVSSTPGTSSGRQLAGERGDAAPAVGQGAGEEGLAASHTGRAEQAAGQAAAIPAAGGDCGSSSAADGSTGPAMGTDAKVDDHSMQIIGYFQ